MGVSAEWVRRAITEGRPLPAGTVKLEAETTIAHTRRTYRIHEHAFFVFLQAIGWKHLPARVSPDPLGDSEARP